MRVGAFAALAVITVVVAGLLSELLPAEWSTRIGAEAVDQVLTIMSSSMLAVTTFSLSVAVSAFTAAAQSATPRATTLLQQDPTTQNVLATFLGAFIFSLLGLVALKAGYYTPAGEFVLFLVTAVVIFLVVLSFLRWISHLMEFGRMSDTLDRVEAAAENAFSERLARPGLGGELQTSAPPHGRPRVCSQSVGYVQHIDMQALADAVEEGGSRIWVVAVPGTFVHENAVLAIVDSVSVEEQAASEIREAFTIGRERGFEQDLRFGLVVLSEIAIRALSPSVNDPGTAIDVIGRLVRVLSPWRVEEAGEPDFRGVVVPPIDTRELLEDAFRPISQNAGDTYEVHLHLQKGLIALRETAPGTFRQSAKEISAYALERAEAVGLPPEDARRLREIAPAQVPV